MNPSGRAIHTIIPVILSLALLAGGFAASTGLYIVDEAVYLSGIHAFWETGGFVIPNGYERYGSTNLGIWHLIEGRGGLVTQYPSGYSMLAAPFYGALGIRGIILLNTLAAIGALFATRALARTMFRDDALASLAVVLLCLATFFAEFAFAVWPHALAILSVTLALLLALRAEDATGPRALWLAVLSGLAVGAGLHTRTDTILILPVIGAHILLFSAAPLRLIAGGAVGLAPGIAAASAINWAKFGTLNPISYGQSGGGVDPLSHLAPAGVLAALMGLMLVRKQIVARLGAKTLGIAAGLAVVAAFAVVPELRLQAARYLRGAYTLFIDITILSDPRDGVQHLDDGSVSFWGLWKKALGQSLPWLAVLLPLMAHVWQEAERRGLALIALATFIWTLPFAFLAWHGGLGANMRYFSPLLPLLAIAGAWGWRYLDARMPLRAVEIIFGFVLGFAAVILWPRLSGSGIGAAHQVFPTIALFVLFAVGCAAQLMKEAAPRMTRVARAALVAGFAIALNLGPISDLSAAQSRRTAMVVGEDVLRDLPGPNLMYGMPEFFAIQIGSKDGLLATTDRDGRVDGDFLVAALRDGYRVFSFESFARALPAIDPRLAPKGAPIAMPGATLLEIALAAN